MSALHVSTASPLNPVCRSFLIDKTLPLDATANDWAVSHGKAQAMVNKMTLEEK
ncbi:hypothetical protein E4U50_006226, partial [Claviceps purpurea]